jgi:hypothetical protein
MIPAALLMALTIGRKKRLSGPLFLP